MPPSNPLRGMTERGPAQVLPDNCVDATVQETGQITVLIGSSRVR